MFFQILEEDVYNVELEYEAFLAHQNHHNKSISDHGKPS
jgi:hypothetical protein